MPLPGTVGQRNQQIDKSRRGPGGEGEGLTKYQLALQQQRAQAVTGRPPQAAPAMPTTRPSQPVPGAPMASTGPILPTPTNAAAQTARPMQPGQVQPQILPPSPGPVPGGPVTGQVMPAPDFAPQATDARMGAAQLSANKQKQALSGGGFKPQYV